MVEVDVAGLTKSEEMHDRLAAAFGFPDYYGKNWDAFWDCILNLETMPQKIRIRGLSSLAIALPREATLLRQSLEDFQAAPEGSAVALEFHTHGQNVASKPADKLEHGEEAPE